MDHLLAGSVVDAEQATAYLMQSILYEHCQSSESAKHDHDGAGAGAGAGR